VDEISATPGRPGVIFCGWSDDVSSSLPWLTCPLAKALMDWVGGCRDPGLYRSQCMRVEIVGITPVLSPDAVAFPRTHANNPEQRELCNQLSYRKLCLSRSVEEKYDDR